MLQTRAFLLVLVAFSTFWSPVAVLAGDLDAQWVLGTWRGTLPSPSGMGHGDKLELTLKPAGRVDGDIESARGGLITYRDGTYKLAGETLSIEVTLGGGPPAVRGSKVTYTLKRSGEDLEGTAFRHWNSSQTEVALKRAK